MKLRYTTLNGKTCNTTAKITAMHSASSYGIPVVVLPDGGALDAVSWTTLGYQIIRATDTEREAMRRIGLPV